MNATSDTERIAGLLIAATSQAAGELRDLAESTEDKETRKAARKALYLLSQKHITPPPRTGESVHRAALPTVAAPFKAYASNVDGAGNRAVYLFYPGVDGGSPTFLQFLTSDEEGIRDIGMQKLARRDVAEMSRALEAQLETGIAFAEIDGDYAVYLLHAARATNQRLRTQTPPGTTEWLTRLPAPRGDYSTPPVYTLLSMEDIHSDPNAPYDPHDLFLARWFDPWFLAVEEVDPWLDSLLTVIPADQPDEVRQAEAQRATAEAVDALIDEETRRRYIRRLEETADVLLRRGISGEARQALYHAIELRSDRPARDVPFAQRLVERTITVALTMRMRAEEE